MIRGLEAFASLAVAERRPAPGRAARRRGGHAAPGGTPAAAVRRADRALPRRGPRPGAAETVTRLWAEGASLDAELRGRAALPAPPPPPGAARPATGPGGLTPREREVVALLGPGLSNQAIGETGHHPGDRSPACRQHPAQAGLQLAHPGCGVGGARRGPSAAEPGGS